MVKCSSDQFNYLKGVAHIVEWSVMSIIWIFALIGVCGLIVVDAVAEQERLRDAAKVAAERTNVLLLRSCSATAVRCTKAASTAASAAWWRARPLPPPSTAMKPCWRTWKPSKTGSSSDLKSSPKNSWHFSLFFLPFSTIQRLLYVVDIFLQRCLSGSSSCSSP